VGFNHRKATAEVTQHLIDLGHRAFAVISAITANNERARQRLTGVTETLERSGLSIPADRLVEAPFSYKSGREALEAFVAHGEQPTAVVCLNDIFAIGAMSACTSLQLRVPTDISITGCEDLEVASMMNPPLTTVRYPTTEMGRDAGAYLISKLAGQEPPLQRIFATLLIVRATTAAPRTGR
jgi:LacI family transcriptional regulator